MEVRYFEVKGKEPAREWLENLKDLTGKAKILRRISRIEEDGNLGSYRQLEHGVYELKIDFGPGYRVYFGFEGKEVVLLLFGGTKRRQQNDIDKAVDYWNIHTEGKNGHRK